MGQTDGQTLDRCFTLFASITMQYHSSVIEHNRNQKKLLSIEVEPTALAWPTNSILSYDLDLQSTAVTTYSQAKVQGQRSVGSEDKVHETNWTDGGDCITFLAIR